MSLLAVAGCLCCEDFALVAVDKLVRNGCTHLKS